MKYYRVEEYIESLIYLNYINRCMINCTEKQKNRLRTYLRRLNVLQTFTPTNHFIDDLKRLATLFDGLANSKYQNRT